MIPIDRIRVLNGPDDVFTFPATAEITELAFLPGALRIAHTKQGAWPPVDIAGKPTSPDDDQEATLWVILQINGEWVAAGMERLRPWQTAKPEGTDPYGFLAGWVDGRPFGPFNGYMPTRDQPVGFLVVAGNSRLGAQFSVRERSTVIEMTYPPAPGTRPVWVEGEIPQPVQPSVVDAPPSPAAVLSPDDRPATKADVDAAKAEILARIDHIKAEAQTSLTSFAPLLERLLGRDRP